VFIRSVTMPLMTIDQLNYNLPFEFRDYITDELKDYYYDYAVVSTSEDSGGEEEKKEENGAEESGGGAIMELMAVAAPKSLIEESKETLHRAGLKMIKAAPTVCAFQSLIRACGKKDEENPQEYCILDLGYQSIRMYMFREDRHMVTRVLELGLNSLDQVISEAYSVDVHLAHTYLLSNYEDCQSKEYCVNAYGTITVELMRALNFYRFSNPDSHLEDIWICGGGACIAPLQQSIAETLDLHIHSAGELIPGGAAVEQDYVLLQAIGIAMD
jgi:type IV pilus assembly protein PilM